MADGGIQGVHGNVKLTNYKEQFEYTAEQIEEIRRCRDDFEYFARKCIIVHPDHGKLYFEPYEYQLKMADAIINNRFVLGKLARQSGKTTIVAAIILWYALFFSDKSIMLLAHKADGARNILRRIQIMYEHLPKWLKTPVVEWNKGSVEFSNGSWIQAAATGPDAGRGESISLLYLDEFAIVHRRMQQEFMTSVYPTVTSGHNTKVVITTTPKGFEAFYRLWQDSRAGKNEYVRITADWWELPGRDEKWKEKMINQLGSERAFNQEFGTEFLGNSNTLIDSHVLENMVSYDPVWEKSDGLRIYEYPQEHHTYMIGVDCGEGVGGDYSAMSVVDVTRKPFRQVAVFQNNTIIPPVFPESVYSVAKMYNDAYVLIELNGPGAEVANDLVYELEYDNVLWTASQGRKGQVLTAGIGGKRLQPGVKTTVATKKKGVINLKGLIENEQLAVYDAETIDELMNFVAVGNSYEGDGGHHDDLVMSLVVFAWASTQEFFSQLSRENVRSMMAKHREKEQQELTPAPMSFIYDNPAVERSGVDTFPGFIQDEEEEELWW